MPRRHPAGKPPVIRPRRWPRRVLIVANVAVFTALGVSGAGYGYVRYRLSQIATQSAPSLAHDEATRSGKGTTSADGLHPENILLIGDQSRAGITSRADIARYGDPALLSGNLSDIIAIVHLDPVHDTATLLSIPRDLFVAMPQGANLGPYQKIDAALNTSVVAAGPDTLIRTITGDLGIPIDHFVELNFLGFRNVVDALGGINLDFPYKLYDAESGLYVGTTGCEHLDGLTALAVVRSRHLQYEAPGQHADRSTWTFEDQSDLARITRTHTFVQVVVATARQKGLTNPVTANAFLGSITGQITIDPGLRDELTTLVTHYRHLQPASIRSFTLPVTQVPSYTFAGQDFGDVDFPVQPLDQQAINAWSPGTLPAGSAPTAVEVSSISSFTATSRLAADLRSAGLPASAPRSAAVPASTTETVVRYPPADLASAEAVMADLAGAVILQPDTSLPAGTVALEVGSSVAATGPAAAASRHPTASTTMTSVASHPTSASSPTTSTTSIPTPGGQVASAATDTLAPWDPRPC